MSTTLQHCRVVPVPGPPGAPGRIGTNGTAGSNAWASLTATFTVPAQSGTGVVAVDHSDWMAIGEPVFIEGVGTFQVTAIIGNNVTLLNLQDGTGSYPGNAAPGSIASSTTRITPSGFEGPSGASGGLTLAQVLAVVLKTAHLAGATPPIDGSLQALFVFDLDTGFQWTNISTLVAPSWVQH